MIYPSAEHAWVAHIQDLLAAPQQRLMQYLVKWTVSVGHGRVAQPPQIIRDLIDDSQGGERYGACGLKMTCTQWNMNKIFPLMLWKENGSSLKRMLQDPRFVQPTAQSKKDNWSSIFGRIGMQRKGLNQSYVEYFLQRWTHAPTRGLPIFYFDPEPPEYVLQPMINNPKMIRHNRVANSCIMAVSLKYESKPDCLFVSIMMRSNLWTHTYGDIFGGSYIGLAFCQELGIGNCQTSLFMPSSAADDKPTMRAILNYYKEN